MPTRARSHILEEESVRRFSENLPAGWVYRDKKPDYGIDGEVEIFNADGSPTGLSFNVQLRATDDTTRAKQVRLEVDELNYYQSFDLPTAIIRYGSQEGSLFWQWASYIISRVKIAEGQKTVTYRFNESDRWSDATPAPIRRTLEVRRRLSNFPPSAAIPLRIDLSALPETDRYPLDRAIAHTIAESNGAVVRASSEPADVEAVVRLEPNFLSVGIDTLTGATFDLHEPTTDDYLASILYGLVRIFRRQRLLRQAESLALLLAERRLAHHSEELAFEACIALARDLPQFVRLAIANGFHKQGPMQGPIALTITKAPQDREARHTAMETFFEASLDDAREVTPTSEAAAHYSIGNFYRGQSCFVRAAYHYNRARHLRPAYLQTDYFLTELAGVLFLAGHYTLATTFYREAVRLRPQTPDLVFLLGDALLLSGSIGEARACFEEALESGTASRLLCEAELKIFICDHLIASTGLEILPRRRAEANSAMRSDGRDGAEHLEHLICDVDTFHPLARFNLGIMQERQGDRNNALYNFLICATVQPGDVEAWANASICALGLGEDELLLRIMNTAIHHMGGEAYDHFRTRIAAQSPPESLALFDKIAMQLLAESDGSRDNNFTLRMLDGDSYHTMVLTGLGEA